MLKYIPNHHINLIQASAIEENSFEKFKTGLGAVLKCLKHTNDIDLSVLQSTMFSHLDLKTAQLIKEIANLEIDLNQYTNQEGEINMCLAYENTKTKYIQEGRMQGFQQGKVVLLINLLKNGMDIADVDRYTGIEETTILDMIKEYK